MRLSILHSNLPFGNFSDLHFFGDLPRILWIFEWSSFYVDIDVLLLYNREFCYNFSFSKYLSNENPRFSSWTGSSGTSLTGSVIIRLSVYYSNISIDNFYDYNNYNNHYNNCDYYDHNYDNRNNYNDINKSN